MTLVKYNPAIESFVPSSFRGLVDRFLDNSFEGEFKSSFVPTVDIAETEKSFEIQLSLPGVKKEDVNIDVEDRKLIISGERKFEKKDESKNFRSIESSYGQFTRSFYVPENVNVDKITATYQDGILNIVIPKDEKKTLKNKIQIK
ncbi:MAG: Hsp20/alpha crystallin family protein [Bacteroidota bacterium]